MGGKGGRTEGCEEENLMQNKKPGKGRLKKKSVFQELH